MELEELSHLEADKTATDTSKSSRTSSADSEAAIVNDEIGVELEDEENEEDDGAVTADSKKVRKRKAKLTKLITDGKLKALFRHAIWHFFIVESVKTKRLQTAVYCVAYIGTFLIWLLFASSRISKTHWRSTLQLWDLLWAVLGQVYFSWRTTSARQAILLALFFPLVVPAGSLVGTHEDISSSVNSSCRQYY